MRRSLATFVVCLLMSALASANPLLEPWSGPHGGLPPFDKVRLEHFKPAFDAAIAERRAEIRKISDSAEPPTFANTLEALEGSGRTLGRVSAVFYVWAGNIPNDEIRALEREMSPIFSALSDEFWQDEKLYRRVEAVHASAEYATLGAEEKRLVDYYRTKFALNGARLDAGGKSRVFALNQELAKLQTQFHQNIAAEETERFLVVDDARDLAGLPDSLVADAVEMAKEKKLAGKWVFPNSRMAMEPLLTFASNREFREKAFRMWTARGDVGNAHDNNRIAAEILKLRKERSLLLGFPTFAHWRLADTMAAEPKAAADLLTKIWKPAVARVREEVADMQRIADAEGAKFPIAPWDYRYYAEKVRKEKYDLDLAELTPYLTIENVRRAMFFAANKLYGTTMRKLETAPVFADGVTAYEVLREGKVIGVWYFDPYARAGKRSGAWSSSFREQDRLSKPVLPIAYDTENFPASGSISWDDATTLFHEFGHAQHTLYSNVRFPTLAGTNVMNDFVELPSHFNENFLFTDEALGFLVDAAGKPIPRELVEKLKRSMKFNEGFATVEFLASAIVDMELHLAETPPKDMREFEARALAKIGMPDEIVMRHRIPHFAHIFTSEQYAAGYYSYLWAQVLVADAFEAFTETGDPYHRATAQRFFDYVLSTGGSLPAEQAFRGFRGRDARVDALLRQKGFPCAEALADEP